MPYARTLYPSQIGDKRLMIDVNTRARKMKRRNGALIAIAVTAAVAAGCGPNVQKLRTEQDEKMQQDRRAAITEYKTRYEAEPKDAVAAYLYARVLQDVKPATELTTRLVSDHPDFAWGHLLLGSLL